MAHSIYYDSERMKDAADSNRHRNVIGGLWDEVGDLQMKMLQQEGMRPEHTLLDIGCGSLRLGCKAAVFLEAGHYWGTDLVKDLIDAGYQKEILPLGLEKALPRSNLVHDQDFTFSGIPDRFDFVVAQSVFTHLPLNHLRQCLARLAGHLKAPTKFLFTVFQAEPGTEISASCLQSRGGITTHPHRDPYHYRLDDLAHAARDLPWQIDFIGEWDHPRNQKLVRAVLSP